MLFANPRRSRVVASKDGWRCVCTKPIQTRRCKRNSGNPPNDAGALYSSASTCDQLMQGHATAPGGWARLSTVGDVVPACRMGEGGPRGLECDHPRARSLLGSLGRRVFSLQRSLDDKDAWLDRTNGLDRCRSRATCTLSSGIQTSPRRETLLNCIQFGPISTASLSPCPLLPKVRNRPPTQPTCPPSIRSAWRCCESSAWTQAKICCAKCYRVGKPRPLATWPLPAKLWPQTTLKRSRPPPIRSRAVAAIWA